MVIVLFIITFIKEKYSKVPKFIYYASIVFWVGINYITFNLYLPQNAKMLKINYGIDLSKFDVSSFTIMVFNRK